jgi:carbon monoxide dehydrogenase subunit G
MELEHSFTIPVPLEQAWETLLDVERVAPCMPGATVDSVEGEVITGRIKVKVGPVTLTYAGKAHFRERDADARTVTLEASGREARGAGTATATVRSVLQDEGDQTRVIVHTTLAVTGRPAQVGRGMLTEVGGRIIDTFAANLAAELAAGQPVGQAAVSTGNGAGPEAAAPGPALAAGIGELKLPARATASLRAAGLDTVADLAARDDKALLALPGVGPQTVAQIRSKLAGLGVQAGLAGAGPASAGPASAGPASAGPASAGPAAEASDADLAAGTAAGSTTEGAPVRPATPAPVPAPGTDVSGAAGGPGPAAPAAAAPTPAAPSPAAPTPAAPSPAAPAPAGPAAPPRRLRPPDEEAIDLLNVAGLPILKRILPAAGGFLVLLILLFAGLRRRRRRHR